jgi:hypothetical protein
VQVAVGLDPEYLSPFCRPARQAKDDARVERYLTFRLSSPNSGFFRIACNSPTLRRTRSLNCGTMPRNELEKLFQQGEML